MDQKKSQKVTKNVTKIKVGTFLMSDLPLEKRNRHSETEFRNRNQKQKSETDFVYDFRADLSISINGYPLIAKR